MPRTPAHVGDSRKERRTTMATATRYLTIKQFCEELDVAQSTFHDWRAKGLAPRCIKLPNGQIRIRRTDLDAWLEARELAGVAA